MAKLRMEAERDAAARIRVDRWISIELEPDAAARIHVRVAHHDGRLVITDMYIHAAPEITPEILRGISVSRLQAMLNVTFQAIKRRLDLLPAELCYEQSFTEAEPSLAELRARMPAPVQSPERQRLTRPDGDAPEEFYPRVAAAYSEYAPRTRAPAKEIAAEAGVPVTTAHRWIREARRRGFLPPARKGKAG